jgi:hypothetical protein
LTDATRSSDIHARHVVFQVISDATLTRGDARVQRLVANGPTHS